MKPSLQGVHVQLSCTVAFSVTNLDAQDTAVVVENAQLLSLNLLPPPAITEELTGLPNAATGSSLRIPHDADWENGRAALDLEVTSQGETPGMVLLPPPSSAAVQTMSHGRVTTSQTTPLKLPPLSQTTDPDYEPNLSPIRDIPEGPSKSTVFHLSPHQHDTNTPAAAPSASLAATSGSSSNVNTVVENFAPSRPFVSGAKVALEKAKIELADIETRSFGNTIDSILKKMNFVINLGDKFAELNPYAKLAWGVVSLVPKAISAQGDCDESVLDLCTTIDTAFSFLEDAEQRPMLDSRKTVFTRMVQQTTECAYFVSEYARNSSFWKRVGKHTITDIDGAIKSYKDKFAELSAAFQMGTNIETEICVLRVLDSIHSVDIKLDLMDMPYAKGAGYRPEKQCLPNTRQGIVDEIIAWVNTPNVSSRLFWLSGVAGSGKTSIANTVARIFDDQKRLGSFFAFDIAHQADRRPRDLFSTIAVNLAALDIHWRTALWKIIKDDRALRTTWSPELQFTKFLLETAKNTALNFIGPIVIMIDGIDESGDEDSRRDIIRMLSQDAADLPTNFRIILTSRPERDIRAFLSPHPHIHEKSMSTVDLQSTANDIRTLVHFELSSFIASNINWTEDKWLRILVDRSEGLFQWASTACWFIKGTGRKVVLTPVERFEIILNATNLDSLYFEILSRTFAADDNTSMNRVKAVLGMVVTAIEPLSTLALYDLCDDLDGDIVDSVLEPLGALLTGIGHKTAPVRPLHTSFHDFLVNATRSNIFFVDARTYHRVLLSQCLRIMKARLRFNICDLETSYLLNNEVPDLSSRIDKHIPPSLSYACRFGLNHLTHVLFDCDIFWDLHELMYKKFLYWLEVMSIIGADYDEAHYALRTVVGWSKVVHRDLAMFTGAAARFIRTFRDPIWQSAPHIYLSALPFEPKESLISKTFLHLFPNTLSVEPKSPIHDNVRALVYSPDGTCIVSGSQDAKIHVWNVQTGQVVAGPLPGHNGMVIILAYSPNGRYICSGSDVDDNVRLWALAQPDVSPTVFRGYSAESVISVSFSPDSRHIASGSWYGTVRLWDIDKPDNPPQTFDYHTHGPVSVVFSRDKPQIRSGSTSRSNPSGVCMSIWDLNSGAQTMTHLSENSDNYSQITVSLGGRYVAATFNRRSSIFIWDTENQNRQYSLLKPHGDSNVYSLAFSSTSKHLALGSRDGEVSVWDVEARTCVGQFRRHGSYVGCVAFSPDETHIVSGSSDGTIHVLDISNMQVGHGVVKKMFWLIIGGGRFQDGIWWTDDAIYLGGSPNYIIDRTRFVHGPRWTDCKASTD